MTPWAGTAFETPSIRLIIALADVGRERPRHGSGRSFFSMKSYTKNGLTHSRESILNARLVAQGLDRRLKDEAAYPELFRRLQPVSPIAMTYPGNPPALVKRTTFDSGEASDHLRGDRKIVKARFLGGTVGYVLVEHLEDHAVVFRKTPARWTPVESEVLSAVRELGPITPRLLKEETGILAKKVGPALARLQRAFLVFEDQTETNWERGWSTFSSAFPDLDLDSTDRDEAARRVLGTFFRANIFATLEQIRDWSELPIRDLNTWIEELVKSGAIEAVSIDGLGEGWIMKGSDRRLYTNQKSPEGVRPLFGSEYEFVPKQRPDPFSVHMLHLQDGLVRTHRTELKRRFAGREILQYLLIDGQFTGAVAGHWRIGPHDVDDIVLELPKKERMARRKEILKEVASTYSGERHRILRYDGKPSFEGVKP